MMTQHDSEDALVISALISRFEHELLAKGGKRTDIVGMAIRPDVYQKWATLMVSYMVFKSVEGIANTIRGIPYVVFGITYKTTVSTVPLWTPEVTFFTDEDVWRRFLQHTDD